MIDHVKIATAYVHDMLVAVAEADDPKTRAHGAGQAATAHAVLAAVAELRALRPNLDRVAASLDTWAARTGAATAPPAAAPRDDDEPTVPADPLHVLVSEWQNTTCSDRNTEWALRDCADRLARVLHDTAAPPSDAGASPANTRDPEEQP